MGPRRKAREIALQVLYAMDMRDDWHSGAEEMLPDGDAGEADQAFCADMVDGVRRQRSGIDARIGEVARHWEVHRMGFIERNLLRMAAYELLCRDDIPARVSINEALELAREYAAPETRRFLNGILDRIAREKLGPAHSRG